MQKFRLKTSEVSAVQVDRENLHEAWDFLGDHIYKTEIDLKGADEIKIIIPNKHIEAIEGPEARFVAKHGDWIVKESGDFYVFPPKTFERMYELIEKGEQND